MINSCYQKQRAFFPNSLFNKNRKAKGCATYAFAYCHIKPAMTTHQIFNISEHNYILSAGIYQLQCHEMCRGFTGTNDGCHEALVLFQKATELETSFLRFSTIKPNFLPPLHISIIQYGCKNCHFLICRENFHFLMNWKHLFLRSSTFKPNFLPPRYISIIQYG